MHDAIKKCADYKMVVDVHDEYRPTGFSRTYPNFLTQEGIRGDEESPPNTHTLITMFTRMMAGAGDNTICYYDNRSAQRWVPMLPSWQKQSAFSAPYSFLYWYDRPVPSPTRKWNFGENQIYWATNLNWNSSTMYQQYGMRPKCFMQVSENMV
jgi:alpha-glucosidase